MHPHELMRIIFGQINIQSTLAIVDFLVTRKLSTTEGESTILKDIKSRDTQLVTKKLSTILKSTIARVDCIGIVVVTHDHTHLKRDQIESNLSVPVIQGHQENVLIKSFEMSPLLICL